MKSSLAYSYDLDDSATRREVFEDFLRTPPKNDDELHWWIKVFCGYDIPRRPSGICPADHTSPFAFVADQFFSRNTSVFGFANRNGGKTLLTAVLNACDMVFKPGYYIVSAGAVREQAAEGYRYLLEIFSREQLLAEMVAAQPTMDRTFLVNGSRIKITTASYAGLNGPHPNALRLDECELIHPSYLAEGLSMTQSHPDGWKAQDTFTSTRKVSAGTVQKLIDEAAERNLTIAKWCIWENIERCTRSCKDPETGKMCPAYAKPDKDGNPKGICGIIDGAPTPHGRAQQVPPGGFYKIEDFIKKVAILDRQTWETQWVNEKPTGGSLVYGDFFKDEAPFVLTDTEARLVFQRMQADRNWMRVIGIDFGSNFAVAYWAQDPHDGVWYKYHEIFWTPDQDLPLEARAKKIREDDPLGWSRRTMIFADPSGKQQITDLQTFGLDALPANNDVFAGINFLKARLESRTPQGLPGARYFPSCKNSIVEMGSKYVHPQTKSGDIDRDKILKKNDHNVDADRYALFSATTIGTSVYKSRRLRGVW